MPSIRKTNRKARRPIIGLEDRIYYQQMDMVTKRYGHDVMMNLGWGVTGDDEMIGVATKVYVSPTMIIDSVGYYKTGRIEHSWEEY